MAKKCCNKWKKKGKFCSSCPIPKDARKALAGEKPKKGAKVKKAKKGKKKKD